MLKEEFEGYNTKKAIGDLLAGITVAAVALPLALAFGVSSGADAAAGMITAIIAGLVIGTLSGGYYQISGPTGAMAAVLMSVVARSGIQGVLLAAFLAGAMLVLAGVLKLGKLTSFIPMPVITGFTSGIAVIIALGQLDNLFGVTSKGETALQKLMSYGALGFSPNWIALGIGLCVILFMTLYPKKWNAVVPASLISIVLATAACLLFAPDVKTVGAIPQTLLLENRLSVSSLTLENLSDVLSPALSIAMLGMIESLLCGASAGRMTGKRLDSNQELIAQGIGNMVLPFFGGIPATAAIARTSVAIKSGAVTRLASIFHALALLCFMLLLAPLMARIPLSALAGVLMVTAWRMNEWHAIRYLLKNKLKGATLVFFATMAATIVFDLTAAILIGVGIAVIHMLRRMAKLEISYAKVDVERIKSADADMRARLENAMVAYIYGPIMFANAQVVEDMAVKFAGCKEVYLSMRGVSDIDTSGAQALMALVKALQSGGAQVLVAGLPEKASAMCAQCGVQDVIGKENLYFSIDRALMGNHDERQFVVEE
ncbi:MAG: SulP family inorganic anion transporter [Clostridia bacterium]